ncbi:hypothetical protein DPMN_089102 [Dreissena polymorpha]|uniref:Uncharacterized protein n=1 Tax=Dreissena polymorpha TaxID=45954 RepID=A0A9D4QYI0_DREPO|nr:hypothetical protein DPMN_089102 [Dreissena polymorpha]
MKNAPHPGGHVFQPTGTILELSPDIFRTNINVTSRVLTRPELFFELIQDIIKTNVLTKFHADWTINLTFRVLTRLYNSLGIQLLTKFESRQPIRTDRQTDRPTDRQTSSLLYPPP